jgi:hypothetical protein
MTTYETTFQPTPEELATHLKAGQLVVFINSGREFENNIIPGQPVRVDITSVERFEHLETIGGVVASPPKLAGMMAVAHLNMKNGTGYLSLSDSADMIG